ncbi:MAG: hypothetical protein BWK80_44690 [Desulfobacteraceae bacterium IS3]|nr:MAG: hypothetical protein BWK80_44690 [Desulfobacteraceae bacterium IS3]
MVAGFPPEFQILYVIFSLFIGLSGYNRKMGFWGYFFSSLLFTPVIGLLLVLVSEKTGSGKP